MKKLPETKALRDLQKLKNAYQTFIRKNYEHRAASCVTCPTKGACCLDEHFVNVHVSKLEAVAISKVLGNLSAEKRKEIYRRVVETIDKYGLNSTGDTFDKTFACPLFEKNVGCLVHSEGKPTPCISHACYENKRDLPPDNLQTEIEIQIERLNKMTYGKDSAAWLPLPVWLDLLKR